MADLLRIQNQMNQLSSLIQEVEAMLELADAETIKNKLLIWKSETDAILEQEIDDYTREVEDFNRRWRMPMVGNTLMAAIRRKFRNAHADLRLIVKAEQPASEPRHARPDVSLGNDRGWESLSEYAITDYAKPLFNL